MASRLPGAPRRTASTKAASSARAPSRDPAARPSITDTPIIVELVRLTDMAGPGLPRTIAATRLRRGFRCYKVPLDAGRHSRLFLLVGRLRPHPRNALD